MPAVDGVDLTVNEGEIYGFLGVNGAGKTTTIRLLMGNIAVEAGTSRRSCGGDSGRGASAIGSSMKRAMAAHRQSTGKCAA